MLALALRYRDAGADELVFYDITASPEARVVDVGWVASVARVLDIPFCVAGGIRSVGDAERLLAAGAEKVSVNTPALANPRLIDDLARRFGSQCVVVGVDSGPRVTSLPGASPYEVHRDTGDLTQTRPARRDTMAWLAEAVDRGAGEIVLNCMNADGTREGYDLAQLALARSTVGVPLIASGGAGTAAHFLDVFRDCDVDGALAASVFHRGTLAIPDLKAFLGSHGLAVRPAWSAS